MDGEFGQPGELRGFGARRDSGTVSPRTFESPHLVPKTVPESPNLKKYAFVPVMAIRLRFLAKNLFVNFPDTLEFDLGKIGKTISYGREVAKEAWPSVEMFLKIHGVIA